MIKHLETEHIIIRFLQKKPKTEVYEVVSKSSGARLAEIKWFTNWRQYAFYPYNDTIWNDGCLVSVTNFMLQLRKDRKQI